MTKNKGVVNERLKSVLLLFMFTFMSVESIIPKLQDSWVIWIFIPAMILVQICLLYEIVILREEDGK